MQGRKIFIVALIALAVLAVAVVPLMNTINRGSELYTAREDRIVVINLSGVIQDSAGGFIYGAGISPRLVYSQLKRAADDPSIKGVVLRVDSSGGSIAASQEIAAMVRKFEKPIVVSMGDMAASGGYYISAPAQAIVAQSGTMTGSIGVISTVMNLDGLYEMLGVDVEVFKSGEHKDMLNRTMTEEERLIMQNISDEAYAQFIAEVSEGRGIPIEVVRELATGQIYLGSQALELGLVDRLGGLEEAIGYLAELNDFENPVRYEFPQPSMFTQLFDYGYRALATIEKAVLGPEIIMFELLREGITPDIRYQVR
ncbi:MAG: signal peptide peptidase SppA [Firmicutes bacterium]|nr:signal peptide peptidase SppA [Bacillota bacterium]